MNENRPCLRIWMTRRNCCKGKQDHPLARCRPSQTMATGISSRRIDCDCSMIGRAAFGRPPRRFRDFSFQRNHSKIGSSHDPTYVPPSSRASTKFGRRILRSPTSDDTPDGLLQPRRKYRDRSRKLFRRRSMFLRPSRDRRLDRQLWRKERPNCSLESAETV